MRRLLRIALIGVNVASTAHAQAIHGVVVDPSDRPVAGVVLLLVDGASKVSARTLSNERGEFRLQALSAGTYRVRTTRIGFRSLLSDPLILGAGEEVTRRLGLSAVPFVLDTVRSTGRNACRVIARDSAAATFAIWEQVRAALTATQLTATARTVGATTMVYDRTLDLSGKRILKQNAVVRFETVTQPWKAIAPDSLRRVGYVTTDVADFTIYYAPALDALLSTAFLEDHCLRIADSRDPSRLAIEFEPTSDRRRVAEIRGTVWLDRKSSELRAMDFRYVNVSRDVENNAGGSMEFARMRNGSWAISRWNIRMPVFAQYQGLGGRGYETRMSEIRMTGGELILATTLASGGKDTVWSRPALTLSGLVRDSVSGAAVRDAHVVLAGTLLQGVTNADGRFAIAGVLPGNYSVEVRTPSLDAVNTIHEQRVTFTDSASSIEIRVPSGEQITAGLCGRQLPSTGIVIGNVALRFDTMPQRNVVITGEWTEVAIQGNAIGRNRSATDARTNASGAFRLCGVPVNTDVTVRAASDSAVGAPVVVRIPGGQRFARVDFTLDKTADGAVFAGLVLVDSTKQPLANAEVSLPDLSLSGQTNDKGEFRLNGISAGSHQVVVRRLGYGQLDTRIDFAANKTVERTIYLNRIITLDSVVVNAPHRDVLLEEFEENRKRGFGSFVTRAELEKQTGRSLAAVMTQTPGLGIVRGASNRSWVTGKRAPISACSFKPTDDCLRKEGVFYLPDQIEKSQGVIRACYAQVYVDRVLMNPGRPTPPFNLNDIVPSEIEAIEWYTSQTDTPQKYSGGNKACGTMVIHRRR